MNQIKIKRNKLRFFLTISFTTILYVGLSYILLIMFIDEYNDKAFTFKGFLGLACCCFFIPLAVYTVIRYLKNSPTIQVDKEQIKFNSEGFYWKDIESISLTGKKPYKYIFNFPREGVSLELKNGDVIYFFDDMYSRAWQVKTFIKDIIIDKNEVVNLSKTKPEVDEIKNESFEIFKGNQFKTYRGLLLWVVIVFCIYIIIKFPGSIVTVTPFCALWFFICSRLMNYFSLSNNYLIVRNHNFLWKKRIYRIEDIEEVVFEIQIRKDMNSNCMRVITKDYRDNLFPAETLTKSMWISLGKELKKKKIKVRNERD